MKNSHLLDAVVNTVGFASMVFGFAVILLLLVRATEQASREQCDAGTGRDPFGRPCVRFSRLIGGTL